MEELDHLIEAKIIPNSNGQEIEIRLITSPELFNYRHIDEGTQMLIEQMDVHEKDDCLDLGCGYGPIGVVMALMAPKGTTYMVDRDFIAIDYAKRNIKENNLKNAQALLSNGFSHIDDKKFDVISSNLPAHVSHEALRRMIDGMHPHLKENGRVYVVVISMFGYFVKRELMKNFKNCKKLKEGPKHIVFSAVKKL